MYLTAIHVLLPSPITINMQHIYIYIYIYTYMFIYIYNFRVDYYTTTRYFIGALRECSEDLIDSNFSAGGTPIKSCDTPSQPFVALSAKPTTTHESRKHLQAPKPRSTKAKNPSLRPGLRQAPKAQVHMALKTYKTLNWPIYRP